MQPTRASWPIAIARAVGTAREALRRARTLCRDLEAQDAQQRALRLADACAGLNQKLRVNVQVQGEVPVRPSIIVANHLSYLDPLAIGQTLPVGAVAKSEIMGWPGVGQAVAELGIIFVKRGCPRSGAVALRRAMRLLEASVSVLVFPEGTTSRGHDVLPFLRGAFGVARLMRVPVVPVTVRYDSPEVPWVGDDSLLPHALRLHRLDEINAHLVFGPSLQPMAFPGATELGEATRRCIRGLLLP
jgi:1-acyl-sn-glycerol-3-phosphate acyltransferase